MGWRGGGGVVVGGGVRGGVDGLGVGFVSVRYN